MVAAYKLQGDSFVAEKPRLWSERRLGDVGFFPGFDVAPDGTRVLALLAPEDARPETSLRVLQCAQRTASPHIRALEYDFHDTVFSDRRHH